MTRSRNARISHLLAWGKAQVEATLPRGHVPPEVLRQQLNILNGLVSKGIFINATVTLTLGWSFMAPGNQTVEVIWMLGSFLLYLFRYADCLSLRNLSLDPADLARARRTLQWGAALQGLVWAVAGTVMLPASPVQQMFLGAVLAGMTSGGIIIFSPIWSVYALYTIPAIFPLGCRLLLGDLLAQRLIGALGLAYGVFILIMAAQVSRWLENSLMATRENKILASNLQAANQALVEYHTQLETAVVSRTQELSEANARLKREMADKDDERIKAEEGEEALRRSQKMESLGLLAGGIAHEFNNLLAVLLGNLNMLQLQTPAGAPGQPFLENMEKAVNRASSLTRQMLVYSGKDSFSTENLDLNQVVLELASLLRASISKRSRLNLELGSGLCSIFGDLAQLQQVLMNLVTNASESLDGADGEIHVVTRIQDLDAVDAARVSRVVPIRPGPHVVLEVRDSGAGMSPEILPRIFDPFYSTKAHGRGLGLSATLGIVRGHGAGIEILSRPLQGTTFRIFFPAGSALPEPVEPALPPPPAQFKGRVLLVDDEPEILDSAGVMLTSLGLEVTTAQDGVQAMALLGTGAEPDLVLLDLTMPNMDGHQTLEAIRRIHPGLPVILSSGYDPRQAFQGWQIDARAFLWKPYTRAELQRTLAEAFGSSPVLQPIRSGFDSR